MRWLGTEALTWRDLLVIVRSSRPGSEIYHALNPDEPGPEEVSAYMLQLARANEYSGRWLQWAKTQDAEKGRNVPEPFRFPWEPKPENKYRGDSMTWDEAADFLGWQKEMDAMGGGA